MPLLVLLPSPRAAADCTANPPESVVIFEVTDEPDGVRWTVAQGGWSGHASSDVSVAGGAVNTSAMEEVQGPPLAIQAGGGDGRFHSAFTNAATDTSEFVPLSTGGFQATLLEKWGAFPSACSAQGDSQRNDQLLRLTSDGSRFFNTANQSGGCWATGASALNSGSFAEHGIIPGIESSFKVCREEDPFEIRIHTLATSSLTVVVDAVPADGTDFDFTAQPAGDATGTPFALDDAVPDDGDGVAASIAVPGVIADTWEVALMVPPGWNLEGATCTGGADAGSLAAGTQPATLTVDVAAREDIVCTFSLTKKGSVTIVHDATPDDPQDFPFAGDLGAFTLDDDADPTWPDSITVPDLVANTYAVSTAVPTGWTLENIVCDDPEAVPNVAGASVAIAVDVGEDVTCTFQSTKHATLEVVQATVPQQPQDFAFDGDLGPFALDHDADPTLADTASFSVLPGSYQVTQTSVPGFDLQPIQCSDGDSNGDLGTATATFQAAAGESITCTFENHQRGSVTLEVVAIPGDPQDFTLTGDLGTFTLDDDGGADSTHSDSVTLTDVATGGHTMGLMVPAGWSLSTIACDDADSAGDPATATVDLAIDPAEDVRCTFEFESAETDLGLTKHLLDDGGSTTVDFLLVVTNHGPAPATGVMVVDALPDGLAYQGNDCGAAFSIGPPETLTWSLGTLQVGEAASCILTAQNQLAEPVVNEATIELDQQDPGPGNNIGSAPVGPVAIAIPTGTAPGLLLLMIALGAAGTLAARPPK